jgi:hypothetical protein
LESLTADFLIPSSIRIDKVFLAIEAHFTSRIKIRKWRPRNGHGNKARDGLSYYCRMAITNA